MDVVDIKNREEISSWASRTQAERSVWGSGWVCGPGTRESWVLSQLCHLHRQLTVTLAPFLNLNRHDNKGNSNKNSNDSCQSPKALGPP